MKNFYNKFSFLLAFMIFIVFFNMLFGEKPTQYFLILVLLGMVILNVDDFKNIVSKSTSNTK